MNKSPDVYMTKRRIVWSTMVANVDALPICKQEPIGEKVRRNSVYINTIQV